MKSDADLYLSHFDAIASQEPAFHRISKEGERPPLHVLFYKDLPSDGDSIGVTYGLSLVDHPEWINGRPELIIRVNSTDIAWSLAAGEVAYRLRGDCPFCYGGTIRFGSEISAESAMSAFVVFAATVIDKQQSIVRQKAWNIYVAQLYPIYESELAVIEQKGLEYFFSRPGDVFADVRRDPIR